jgi:hypothetical protein
VDLRVILRAGEDVGFVARFAGAEGLGALGNGFVMRIRFPTHVNMLHDPLLYGFVIALDNGARSAALGTRDGSQRPVLL